MPEARILVDFKDDNVKETVQVIRDAGAADRVIVASFDPEKMDLARRLAPELTTCFDFSTGMAMMTAIKSGAWDAYEPPDDMLSLSRRMLKQFGLTAEILGVIKTKGIVTQVHTINNPDDMRAMIAMGFDSILTDHPERLAQVIAEHGSGASGE